MITTRGLTDGACTGTHSYTDAGSVALAVTATDNAGDSSADVIVLDVVTPSSLVLTPGVGAVMEGDSGQVTLNVPITLSAPSPDPVTVDYTTVDPGGAGVATAGDDYVATSGTVTFAPGQTSKTVPIAVLGDRTDEPPLYLGEWVLVAFSNPTGASIDPVFYGLGVGIIGDDDPMPTIKPGVAAVVEGNSGDVTVQVPVSLANPSASPITVDYSTLDTGAPGVAAAGADYAAKSGTVIFAPGETSKTVSITVHGDTFKEPPLLYGEWILLAFSNPSANAHLETSFFGLGLGIVVDDD